MPDPTFSVPQNISKYQDFPGGSKAELPTEPPITGALDLEAKLRDALTRGSRFLQCRPYDHPDPKLAKSPINFGYTELDWTPPSAKDLAAWLDRADGNLLGCMPYYSQSILFDLDRDKKTGELLAEPEEVEAWLDSLGLTWHRYRTPSGGYHYWVPYRGKPLGNSAWHLNGRRIGDIRCASGYGCAYDLLGLLEYLARAGDLPAITAADIDAQKPRRKQIRDYFAADSELISEIVARMRERNPQSYASEKYLHGCFCPNKAHVDKKPGAAVAFDSGVIICDTCGHLSPRRAAREMGIEQPTWMSTAQIVMPTFAKADVTLDVPFVDADELRKLAANHGFVALQSPLGTGKSTAARDLITSFARQNTGTRVLCLAPTVNLCRQTHDAMSDFRLYSQVDAHDLPCENQLVITLASLAKARGAAGGPGRDLLWIDEPFDTLRQLDSPLFADGEALAALDALRAEVASAKRLLLTGAYIPQEVIDLLQSWHGDRALVIANTYTSPARRITRFDGYGVLIDHALQRAMSAPAGKPVAIGCGGKTEAMRIRELAIAGGMAAKDILLITADTKDTRAVRRAVSDPDSILPRYRLVLYTYAFGIGNSYAGDSAGAYLLASNQGMSALDYAQMAARFRRADEYGYWMPGILRLDLPTDAAAIAGYERTRMATARRAISPKQVALLEVVALTRAIDNRGKQAPGLWLDHLLRGHGFEIDNNTALTSEFWLDAWQATSEEISQRQRELTISLPALSFDDHRRKAWRGELVENDNHRILRYAIERATGVPIDGEQYDSFHKLKARHGLRNLTDALGGASRLREIDDSEEARQVPVSQRRLAEEQIDIIAQACRALFEVTGWAGDTNTIEGTIASYIQLICKRGEASPEIKAAIDALGDEWMGRFCAHIRAERSTTTRAVDVWRQMRNHLSLPTIKRKRQGAGQRKGFWKMTVGSYKTLARNVLRRLAVQQYRQALEEMPAEPSAFCKEQLPVFLLQKVDAVAETVFSLVEMGRKVRQIVRQWRAKAESIPI